MQLSKNMNNDPKVLAPVAIFVYNRLKNTREVIEALKTNYLASETEVFVFSDGAKDEKGARAVNEVRQYLKTVTGFKAFNVIERPENFYIEKNISEGVTEIVNRYGRIIVLEDDGVTAKSFLTFMNDALDFYQSYEKVMHIATFTFIKMPKGYNKTFFWRYSENTGGGWGTWKRAWDKYKWLQSEAEGNEGLTEELRNYIELDGTFKCLNHLKAKPIQWDISWYIAIAKNQGLVVNSPWPLIKNNGLFNGTHTMAINRILGRNPLEVDMHDTDDKIVFEEHVVENVEAIDMLKDFYRNYGNRKRDKVLGFFIGILVKLKITKLLKRIFK